MNFLAYLLFSLFLLKLIYQGSSYSIDDFGAVSGVDSFDVAIKNGEAFQDTLIAANKSLTDRNVVIPGGKNYSFLPINTQIGLTNITIKLYGVLNAWCDDVNKWPRNPNGDPYSLISFRETKGLNIIGNGTINGNGYNWWWYVILFGNDDRPNIMQIHTAKDTLIDGITVMNAPQYHITLEDTLNTTVRNLIVYVDIDVNSSLSSGIPVFPLNTDGIDISGRDAYFYNLTVLNFDDAVAIKPTSTFGGTYSNCTENILVEKAYVKYGVGMSVGSVPPDVNNNCIRNITFRDVVFEKPFKAIYIKPNPGDVGTGTISNILYENIEIYDALWWAIFIGTQQEKQPHYPGTDCSFFYPLPGSQCVTNPQITVSDITLRNVNIYGGVLAPGIMICNQTNPCHNFVFDNVNVYNPASFPFSGYLCNFVSGYAKNSNLVPDCLKNIETTYLN